MGISKYQCMLTTPDGKVCGDQFYTKYDINKHKVEYHKGQLEEGQFCYKCGAFFYTEGWHIINLKWHMTLHTIGYVLFAEVCDLCGKGIELAWEFPDHLVSEHGFTMVNGVLTAPPEE